MVREGFEPSVPFKVRRFSKALLSTTQPPHQFRNDKTKDSVRETLLGQSESSRLKKFITYPMISSKKSQKRLLITGSTGFVGRNLLLHALHDPEWSEIILPVRNQKKIQAQLKLDHLEDSEHRIRLCSVQDNTWDLSDMPPIDMAIHCAGLTFSRDRNPYFQTHVEGSLHLLESLPKSCPLLVLSSQAAAGPSSKMIPLRQENHLEQPLSWYGESKYEMEKALLHHAGDRLLIVRPPMVLGPRDRATIPLFKMAHGPVRFKPGIQKKYFSWIAVHDLCEAILIASKQDWNSLPQRIYFVTHPHAITDLELLNTAAALARIFHTDRDEETVKADGIRQTSILTPGCMGTYRPSHNVSLTQDPSAFPASAVDQCEIFGLAHARGINLPLPHIIIQLISSIADKIPKLRRALPSLGRDRVREIFAKRWVIDGSAFERDFHWKAHRELYETLEETMIWLQQSEDIPLRNRK